MLYVIQKSIKRLLLLAALCLIAYSSGYLYLAQIFNNINLTQRIEEFIGSNTNRAFAFSRVYLSATLSIVIEDLRISRDEDFNDRIFFAQIPKLIIQFSFLDLLDGRITLLSVKFKNALIQDVWRKNESLSDYLAALPFSEAIKTFLNRGPDQLGSQDFSTQTDSLAANGMQYSERAQIVSKADDNFGQHHIYLADDFVLILKALRLRLYYLDVSQNMPFTIRDHQSDPSMLPEYLKLDIHSINGSLIQEGDLGVSWQFRASLGDILPSSYEFLFRKAFANKGYISVDGFYDGKERLLMHLYSPYMELRELSKYIYIAAQGLNETLFPDSIFYKPMEARFLRLENLHSFQNVADEKISLDYWLLASRDLENIREKTEVFSILPQLPQLDLNFQQIKDKFNQARNAATTVYTQKKNFLQPRFSIKELVKLFHAPESSINRPLENGSSAEDLHPNGVRNNNEKMSNQNKAEGVIKDSENKLNDWQMLHNWVARIHSPRRRDHVQQRGSKDNFYRQLTLYVKSTLSAIVLQKRDKIASAMLGDFPRLFNFYFDNEFTKGRKTFFPKKINFILPQTEFVFEDHFRLHSEKDSIKAQIGINLAVNNDERTPIFDLNANIDNLRFQIYNPGFDLQAVKLLKGEASVSAQKNAVVLNSSWKFHDSDFNLQVKGDASNNWNNIIFGDYRFFCDWQTKLSGEKIHFRYLYYIYSTILHYLETGILLQSKDDYKPDAFGQSTFGYMVNRFNWSLTMDFNRLDFFGAVFSPLSFNLKHTPKQLRIQNFSLNGYNGTYGLNGYIVYNYGAPYLTSQFSGKGIDLTSLFQDIKPEQRKRSNIIGLGTLGGSMDINYEFVSYGSRLIRVLKNIEESLEVSITNGFANDLELLRKFDQANIGSNELHGIQNLSIDSFSITKVRKREYQYVEYFYLSGPGIRVDGSGNIEPKEGYKLRLHARLGEPYVSQTQYRLFNTFGHLNNLKIIPR